MILIQTFLQFIGILCYYHLDKTHIGIILMRGRCKSLNVRLLYNHYARLFNCHIKTVVTEGYQIRPTSSYELVGFLLLLFLFFQSKTIEHS
jgi:hypothetical protein